MKWYFLHIYYHVSISFDLLELLLGKQYGGNDGAN